MDTDHRLMRAADNGADCSASFRHRARLILPFGLLMAGCLAYGEGVSEREDPDAQWPYPSYTMEAEQHHAQAIEPLPVIVVLAVDEQRAEETPVQAIAAVRNRLLARIRETIPATDYTVERTYENFPLVSLSVAPAALALLITMPEVESIEPNRTHRLLDPPPSLPSEITTPATDWNTQ